MKANNWYNQLGRDNLRRDAVTGPNNWSINSVVLQCWESVLTRCTIKLTREHKRFNKRCEHNQSSLSINLRLFFLHTLWDSACTTHIDGSVKQSKEANVRILISRCIISEMTIFGNFVQGTKVLLRTRFKKEHTLSWRIVALRVNLNRLIFSILCERRYVCPNC